jgi:hypothetical protein
VSDQWTNMLEDKGEAAVYALNGAVWVAFANRTQLRLNMSPGQTRWLADELRKHADECDATAKRPGV